MILGYHGGDVLFKMEPYDIRITEVNIYESNKISIHSFFLENVTAIALISMHL